MMTTEPQETPRNCKWLPSGAVVMCFPEHDPMPITILYLPEGPGLEPRPIHFQNIRELQTAVATLRLAVRQQGKKDSIELADFEEAEQFASDTIAEKYMAEAA